MNDQLPQDTRIEMLQLIGQATAMLVNVWIAPSTRREAFL